MTDYGSTWQKSPETERIEQAIARYGTPSAASEATGIPLDVLEAAEARINEAVA